MTLPDEVVKEIEKLNHIGYGVNDFQRIALLTRKLTIEEAAKTADEMDCAMFCGPAHPIP